jgi:type II secretory pathway pseudopilin PulG
MEFAGRCNRGYAMAALLVAMSVMAVLMSALLPVWTHMATREKEEELIFRGRQYARAIGLFQRKFANTAPPSIDVLVDQRFLRKKYKDPITNDDFQPLYANQQAMTPGAGAQVAQRPGQSATQINPVQSNPQAGGITPQGGIIGVTSKSKDASIKLYNGRSRYNEWSFIYLQTAQRPGQTGLQMMPGQQQQGGRQGQGGQQPFGMQGLPPGAMYGGRAITGPDGVTRIEGGPMRPPGFGTDNRPPFPGQMPGQFPGQFPNQQNPGTITTPGTTFTPIPRGQVRPPGGQ